MYPRQHNREFVAVTSSRMSLRLRGRKGVPLGDCHGDPNRRPGRGRDGPRHKATRKLGRPLQDQL